MSSTKVRSETENFKLQIEKLELRQLKNRQKDSLCWKHEWDIKKGDKERRKLFLREHAECIARQEIGVYSHCQFAKANPELHVPGRYGSTLVKKSKSKTSFDMITTSTFESRKLDSKPSISSKTTKTSVTFTSSETEKVSYGKKSSATKLTHSREKFDSDLEDLDIDFSNISLDSKTMKRFEESFSKKLRASHDKQLQQLKALKEEFLKSDQKLSSKRYSSVEIQNRAVFDHGILEESTQEESDLDIDWDDDPCELFSFVENRVSNLKANRRRAYSFDSDDSSDEYNFNVCEITQWDIRVYPNVYNYLRRVYLDQMRKERNLDRWEWIYYIPDVFPYQDQDAIKECIRKTCYSIVVEQMEIDQNHFKLQRKKKLDLFSKPKVIVSENFIRRTLFWKIAKILQSTSARFLLPEWRVRTPNEIVYYFTEVIELVQLKDGDFDEKAKVSYNQLLESVELMFSVLRTNKLDGVVERVLEGADFQFWKRGETNSAKKMLKIRDLQRIFKVCYQRHLDHMKRSTTSDMKMTHQINMSQTDISNWLSNASISTRTSNGYGSSYYSNETATGTTSYQNSSSTGYNSTYYQSDYTSQTPTSIDTSYQYQNSATSYPSSTATTNKSWLTKSSSTTESSMPYSSSKQSTSSWKSSSNGSSTNCQTEWSSNSNSMSVRPPTSYQSTRGYPHSYKTPRLRPWIEDNAEGTSRYSHEATASEEEADSSEFGSEETTNQQFSYYKK